MDNIYLSFSAEIDQHTTEAFMTTVSDYVNKGVDKINILFSSPGGTVANGVTIYNFLRSIPAKIVMHNIGVVDSIGNLIFLSGEERYAVPNSSFLFHGVGFDILQPTRFEEKQVKEKLKTIERDQKLLSDIISERTKLTEKEVREMFLNAETVTPEKAKELKVINDIRMVNIPKGSQIFQFNFPQRPWR